MDELKKYLQQNARELDVDTPAPQVWENIERATIDVPKKPATLLVFTRWAVAACVILLAGIGGWHLLTNQHQTANPVSAIAKVNAPVVKTAPAEKAPEKEVIASAPIETKTIPHKSIPKHTPAVTDGPVTSAADLVALSNIETSFTQVINLQRSRVSHTPMFAETPAYFDDFKLQIKQIEKDEKVIKSDIAKRGMNDELLDQLINLYQQKLNTLKQLQIEMNKTNNRFKQSRGPVDSTRTYFLNI